MPDNFIITKIENSEEREGRNCFRGTIRSTRMVWIAGKH